MGGKVDQFKGRIKEAAGVIAGNEALKKSGRLDQETGKAKVAAAKVAGKLKEEAAKLAVRVKRKADRSADALREA